MKEIVLKFPPSRSMALLAACAYSKLDTCLGLLSGKSAPPSREDEIKIIRTASEKK